MQPAPPQEPRAAVLARGSSGAGVRAVRDALRRTGDVGARPPADDRFDDALERAVRAFQQRRGLRADGVVGPATARALEEARWRLGDRILRLLPGHLQRGDDVAQLQQRLLALGLPVGRVDGVLGSETEAALRALQRDLGLEPDGVCGPDTLRALRRLDRSVTGGDPVSLREDAAHANRAVRGLGAAVVVLDPAHGGDDPGWEAHGLREADVVLDLASRVEGRLAAAGVTAVLTRGAGSCPSEEERARLAREVGADLVVSFHCEGQVGGSASGVATAHWGVEALGVQSAVGRRLAELLQAEVLARTDLADSRTHASTADLLRLTPMPAVVLELGYLTDPGDARRLASGELRDAVADAVVAAVAGLYASEGAAVPSGVRSG